MSIRFILTVILPHAFYFKEVVKSQPSSISVALYLFPRRWRISPSCLRQLRASPLQKRDTFSMLTCCSLLFLLPTVNPHLAVELAPSQPLFPWRWVLESLMLVMLQWMFLRNKEILDMSGFYCFSSRSCRKGSSTFRSMGVGLLPPLVSVNRFLLWHCVFGWHFNTCTHKPETFTPRSL